MPASHTDVDLARLVADLASDRWSVRRAAEDGLSSIGTAALPALVDSLGSESDNVRWGAVKVLSEIGDSSSIAALVVALEDLHGGVRWLAAQAPVSSWRKEGAHHILRGLDRPEVSPVVQALEERFPAITVPVAASEALKALELQPLAAATTSEARTTSL